MDADSVLAATDMTERDVLAAAREKLAVTIDSNPPAHALTPLVRQLLEVDSKIRDMDRRAKEEAGEGVDVPDEALDPETL